MWFFYQKKNCKLNWLWAFLGLEFLSWLSFNFPQLAGVFLILIGLTTTYWLLKKPIYALYLPLAELFWGSMGHSIYLGIFNLRLLIFVTVLFVWVIRNIFSRQTLDYKNKFWLIWLAIIIFWIIGIFNALNRGHASVNIFLDANAYIYLLYLPVWHQVYKPQYLKNIADIFLAAIIVIACKTIWLFNIYAQNYPGVDLTAVYKWVRDSRTGEITPLENNYFRIFMQSQIYLVVGWFFLFYRQIKHNILYANFSLLILVGTALFISLSRSYWLGVFLGSLYLLISLHKNINWRLIKDIFLALAMIFIFVQIFFNVPNFQRILLPSNQRLQTSEAAVSSRQQLLGPMWDNIKQSIFWGYGFGKEITYQSNDPRIKNNSNPMGWNTTYSFEWGWLDQWLKLGIFFVFLFVLWLFLLYNKTYHLLKNKGSFYYVFPAILLAISLIHVFSPYLNHPLGLGLIMLITIILIKYEKRTNAHN